MNFKITNNKSGYNAIVTDIDHACFCGTGSTVGEAIGQCLMANRELLGITFEIHDGKSVVYSTVYGKPRSPEELT